MTLDELRASVEMMRAKARLCLFREAERLGLFGDPFVTALANQLGEVSLDEALEALRVEARKRRDELMQQLRREETS